MKLIASLNLVLICSTQGVFSSWVDPDTPEEGLTTKALTLDDDREFELVFSDEFNEDGRTFNDGNDPRWTAINKNDYTNSALHFYSHDNARTMNGYLNITTERKINPYRAFDEKKKFWYADKKYIQSAMIQGWNKFCFIGGIVEFNAKLPGDATVGGLWPALWMLGNLARGTYVGSSDYVWPFSYSKCNPTTRKSQIINGCSKVHHYGMDPFVGRGSPEIDILESMQGNDEKLPSTNIKRPYQSCSLQIAPGMERDRPVLGKLPHKGHWYTHLEYAGTNKSELNPFFYGSTLVHTPKSFTYQADGISANLQLNESHYNSTHKYRIEWEPPDLNGTGGYVKWYTDEEFVFAIYGDSLKVTDTEIPSEPMYILMNTAVSDHWGFPQPCPEGCDCECFECGNPDCACALPTGYCDNFPASFEIDYVRIWQAKNSSKHFLGCSPPHRPTEMYIKGHEKRYMSEGQKHPLKPLQRGGGACREDSDCGTEEKGTCTASKVCECSTMYTGPHCRAHAGFFDFETAEEPGFDWGVSSMVFPKSLIVLVIIVVLGFLFSLTGSFRSKLLERKYEKIDRSVDDAVHPTENSLINTAQGASYQDPPNSDYALPPQQKVVTYCVIDGRLVDQ